VAGYDDLGRLLNANCGSPGRRRVLAIRAPKQDRRAQPAPVLLCFLGGCGERPLTEKDVVGTYKAYADWGESTLVLRHDHSFEQTVLRNDHTQASAKGPWQLTLDAGKNESYGMVGFKLVFLAVTHDQKGDPAGGAFPSVGRGLLWGVHIAADPDWGISFEK